MDTDEGDLLHPEATRYTQEIDAVLGAVRHKLEIPDIPDGRSALAIDHARYLVGAILESHPKKTLEVGLGRGYSTAYIMAAQQPANHTVIILDTKPEHDVDQYLRTASVFGTPQIVSGTSGEVFLEHSPEYDLVFVHERSSFEELLVSVQYAINLLADTGRIYVRPVLSEQIHALQAWIEERPTLVRIVDDLRGMLVLSRKGVEGTPVVPEGEIEHKV